MKKNKAFTLAETLIVIGIIGVVAALTLPNLNHATGDKETVTRVKKIYSSLTDAFDRAQVIYGPYEEWLQDIDISCDKDKCQGYDKANERFAKRVTEFMKISKDCGINDNCKVNASIGFEPEYLYTVVLSDGTALSFGAKEDIWQIGVDINGPNKGKNQDGHDVFAFSVGPKGLLPGGYGYYNKGADEYNTPIMCFNMNYCTRWIVENGNLDYLKADDNGVCPNGTQLSWTVTSCN